MCSGLAVRAAQPAATSAASSASCEPSTPTTTVPELSATMAAPYPCGCGGSDSGLGWGSAEWTERDSPPPTPRRTGRTGFLVEEGGGLGIERRRTRHVRMGHAQRTRVALDIEAPAVGHQGKVGHRRHAEGPDVVGQVPAEDLAHPGSAAEGLVRDGGREVGVEVEQIRRGDQAAQYVPERGGGGIFGRGVDGWEW